MNNPSGMPCRADLRHFSRLAAFAACGLSAPAAWSRTLATPLLPRIVSVNGAMTGIAYALGAGAQLAGTDTTSVYPPAALKTPTVGCMRQLSAVGVLSLRPETAVGTTEAGPGVVMDQLRSAGVKAQLVEADHSWLEVRRKVSADGLGAMRRVLHENRRMSSLRHLRIKMYRTVARQLHGMVPCWVCGQHVTFDAATLEHIQALSEGGNSHADNLAISHEVCNGQRHAAGLVPASAALPGQVQRRKAPAATERFD